MKNEDNYVLNLLLKDSTNDELIAIVEEKLRIHGSKITEITPFYELAKSDFEKWESQLKIENEKINDLDILYKALIAYRNHASINKEMRVMRTTSVLSKHAKIKTKSKRVEWMQFVVPILKDAQKFMSDLDLWDTIEARYGETVKSLGGDKLKFKDALYNAGLRENKTKSNVVVRYNSRTGLAEWVDENRIPLPKYLFIGGTIKQMAS